MKKIGIPLFIFILALPLTAFSQWYVGVTGGVYELNESGWDWETAGIYSPRGGYRFNKIFALEGSYVFFGESELENYPYNTIEGGLFDIGLVGTIPVTQKFEIFGRIGYGYWAANIDDYGYNNDDTGSSWNYGGGLAYNFNKNWSLFAGYQRYEFDLDYNSDLSADTVYAGGKFYFDFDKSSNRASSSNSAVLYESQPTPVVSPQLRAVTEAEKNSCSFLKRVTAGAGGPGDPSIHTENAMKKALVSAANAGADSYYVVDTETTDTGASVILEALNCN
jgi:hypothetical protein